MPDVQFDLDQLPKFRSRTIIGQPQVPGMAAWLMKKGLIKDENQAGNILVGIVIFNIVVAILVLYFFVL